VVEGPTDLAERLLVLLDQGAVSTTYKYALLAAMIDVALRHTAADGTVDSRLPVDELADAVLDLYRPQTDPYGGLGGGILRQSGVGQAEIITKIRQFRERDPGARTTLAAARYTSDFPALRRHVAWKLAEMPIPRLQRVGLDSHSFFCELARDDTITRRTFDDPGPMANRAGRCLVRQPSVGIRRNIIQREVRNRYSPSPERPDTVPSARPRAVQRGTAGDADSGFA
jgi:hypothetical protein